MRLPDDLADAITLAICAVFLVGVVTIYVIGVS